MNLFLKDKSQKYKWFNFIKIKNSLKIKNLSLKTYMAFKVQKYFKQAFFTYDVEMTEVSSVKISFVINLFVRLLWIHRLKNYNKLY